MEFVVAVGDPDTGVREPAGTVGPAIGESVADMVAFVYIVGPLEGAGIAVTVTVVTPNVTVLVSVYCAWSTPEMVRVYREHVSQKYDCEGDCI